MSHFRAFARATAIWLALASVSSGAAPSSVRPRARDLGIPFEGKPGPFNAITDVAGVTVGHTTLISGEGKLTVGRGPVRTGVTAIRPRGPAPDAPAVFAGTFALNGNGEMTGTAWIEESGLLEGPILLTNTHSVGVVRDAVIAWKSRRSGAQGSTSWSLPVVAETWDGWLNDIDGFHVKPEHVFHALETAATGPVPEGNVGGGTGMVAYEYKGGIGTASRLLASDLGGYTVGVLVQANHGVRRQLTLAGVPVGREIGGGRRRFAGSDPHDLAGLSVGETGSILIVVATDAPLMPHQLKRLARRAALGLARTGAISGNGSGDLFLAFSTANAAATARDSGHDDSPAAFAPSALQALTHHAMNPLFEATVAATEEAIANALVAATPMTGRDGHHVDALPHDRVRELMLRFHRPAAPAPAAASPAAAPR